MMVQFFSLLFLLYRIVSANEVNNNYFLVRPGNGEEFVYSPVSVNATLHCAVNDTILEWEVDGFSLDSSVQGPQLNSRGIFQSGPIVSSDGVTSSSHRRRNRGGRGGGTCPPTFSEGGAVPPQISSPVTS